MEQLSMWWGLLPIIIGIVAIWITVNKSKESEGTSRKGEKMSELSTEQKNIAIQKIRNVMLIKHRRKISDVDAYGFLDDLLMYYFLDDLIYGSDFIVYSYIQEYIPQDLGEPVPDFEADMGVNIPEPQPESALRDENPAETESPEVNETAEVRYVVPEPSSSSDNYDSGGSDSGGSDFDGGDD